MKTRLVEGPKCAECGEQVGLIQVNGRSILVESTGFALGTALIFERHKCPVKADPETPPTNGHASTAAPVEVNGRGPYRRDDPRRRR